MLLAGASLPGPDDALYSYAGAGGQQKAKGTAKVHQPSHSPNCNADFLTFTQVQVRGTERVLLFFSAGGAGMLRPVSVPGLEGGRAAAGGGASHETEKRKVFLEQIQTQDNHVTEGK